jgi:hypothetical protein
MVHLRALLAGYSYTDNPNYSRRISSSDEVSELSRNLRCFLEKSSGRCTLFAPPGDDVGRGFSCLGLGWRVSCFLVKVHHPGQPQARLGPHL